MVPILARLRLPPRATTFMDSSFFNNSITSTLLVTTVIFLSLRYLVRWMVVDPESIMTVYPS